MLVVMAIWTATALVVAGILQIGNEPTQEDVARAAEWQAILESEPVGPAQIILHSADQWDPGIVVSFKKNEWAGKKRYHNQITLWVDHPKGDGKVVVAAGDTLPLVQASLENKSVKELVGVFSYPGDTVKLTVSWNGEVERRVVDISRLRPKE